MSSDNQNNIRVMARQNGIVQPLLTGKENVKHFGANFQNYSCQVIL